MERMKKEKESGTFFVPVKEIKGEFYVKVSDFTRCMDSMKKELEEENKKLKERVSELEDVSKDYDLLSKDFIALGEENKKLKEELKWWKNLVHKAKEFEYDEDGMDYIWQNTKI